MKKSKILIPILTTACLVGTTAPLAALTSCGAKVNEVRYIPFHYLKIENGVLKGFINKDLDLTAYNTLLIPNYVKSIAPYAFSYAKEQGGTDEGVYVNPDASQPVTPFVSKTKLAKQVVQPVLRNYSKPAIGAEQELTPAMGGGIFSDGVAYNTIHSLIFQENSQCTYIGTAAFCGCTALTNQLALPEGLRELAPYCFAYTGFSNRLLLPQTLRTIGFRSFYQYIPDSTKAGFRDKMLWLNQFTHLTSISIPRYVISVGDEAFAGNYNLNAINLASFNESWMPDWAQRFCFIFPYCNCLVDHTEEGEKFFQDRQAIVMIAPNASSYDWRDFIMTEKIAAEQKYNPFKFDQWMVSSVLPEEYLDIQTQVIKTDEGEFEGKILKGLKNKEDPNVYRTIAEEVGAVILYIPSYVNVIAESAFEDMASYWTALGYHGFLNDLLFENNSALLYINNKAFKNSGITNSDLGYLDIPDSVENIGDEAFCNWTHDTTQGKTKVNLWLKLPRTSFHFSIGAHAFRNIDGSDSLWNGELQLPQLTSVIGDYAFEGCKNINGTLTIPSYCNDIGESAFANTKITKLVIDNQQAVIRSNAFATTNGISTIKEIDISTVDFDAIFPSKSPEKRNLWAADAFRLIGESTSGTIYVKKGQVSSWSNYFKNNGFSTNWTITDKK